MAEFCIIMLKESYGMAMRIHGHEVKVVKLGHFTFIDNLAFEDIKDTLNIGDILEVTVDEPCKISFAIYGLEYIDQALEAKVKTRNSPKTYNMLISKVIKRNDGKNKGILVANPVMKNELFIEFDKFDDPFQKEIINEGDIAHVQVSKLPAKTKYEPNDGIYVLPMIEGELITPLITSQFPIYFYKIYKIVSLKNSPLLKLADESDESWEEVGKALEAAATAVKVKEKLMIKETSLKNISLEWKIEGGDATGVFNSGNISNFLANKVAQKFIRGVKVKLTHENDEGKYTLAKIHDTWHTRNSIGFNVKAYPASIFNMLDLNFSQKIESTGWSLEIPPDFAIPTRFISKLRNQTLPMFRNASSKPTKEIVKALLGGNVEAGKLKYKPVNVRKLDSFLTDEQKEVLAAALNPNIFVVASESVAGSGKSKTLTIVARELLKKDHYTPLLLCASTNVAVRHILTEVVKEAEHIVQDSVLFLPSMSALRNATPAELKICTRFSLYNRLMDLIQGGIDEPDKSIILEAANILKDNANRFELEAADEDDENKSNRQQATEMRKVEQAFKILLAKKTPMIIAATLSMANKNARNLKNYIKAAIFDEAATITMIETLAFTSENSKLNKAILMGDSKQLHSHDLGVPEQCKNLGFASALEHVHSATGPGLKLTKLTHTFRFSKQIAQFVADICYDGELKIGSNLQDTESSLLFVNCKGKEERLFPVSRTNKLQTEIAKQILTKIRMHNENCHAVCLTYYNGQRNELRAELNDKKVEVCNVDSFQGREADIVIILTTLVDSKTDFINDKKRLCVMLTRARKGIIILGHAATLEKMSNWEPVVKKMKELGKFCSPDDANENLDAI